jgi:DnaJ like chaperone protein
VFGKVLGAIIGIFVGLLLSSGTLAIVLAAGGLLIGHLLFDRQNDGTAKLSPEQSRSIDALLEREGGAGAVRAPGTPQRAVPRTHPDTVLAKLLCPLFVEVARCDGAVTREEVRIIREYFHHERRWGEESLEQVRICLKAALAAGPVDLAAATKKARAKLTPAERPLFVHTLYELALIDSELKRAESDAIKQIVNALNLSDEQLKEITAMHLGSGSKHYALLGLTDTASDDEIRSAFRRLAADNHPDRVRGEAAATRFREINEAYQELRKLRGL